ncbi:hypothetical protein F8S13_22415 [Chloroflexia bacterium SDU3-3]|nr:hypothetical protein F8S13_22415 [Chloroflexia bacterium SDU3-3]
MGGSIASTAYSLPRTTYDIDMAAALDPSHVSPLIAGLAPVYSIDHASVREAIAHPDREASFTIIHHETGIPLDIVVTADRPFDQARYDRAQEHSFPGTAAPITLASPEDIILNKLRCSYQDGISSQQEWRDVAGIIRVQDQHLDQSYLRSWATSLGIRPLLDAALRGDAPPAGPAAPPGPGLLFSHTSTCCGWCSADHPQHAPHSLPERTMQHTAPQALPSMRDSTGRIYPTPRPYNYVMLGVPKKSGYREDFGEVLGVVFGRF